MKKSTTMKTRTMTRSDSSEKAKAIRFLLVPVSAVILAVILNSFVILSAIVPSVSMADTLEKGSLLLASRLAYLSSSPERGDIIIFSHPEIDARYVVKRVIAVPGDTVEIVDGRVYINGTVLHEPYVKEYSSDFMEELSVPEECYFVLGDNRKQSVDSRELDSKFVRIDDIHAKALFTLLPEIKSLD